MSVGITAGASEIESLINRLGECPFAVLLHKLAGEPTSIAHQHLLPRGEMP